MKSSAHQPLLLTETEVARILGFSVRTLQKWRVRGEGPPFMKVSARAIRYRRSDIKAWVEANMRISTSDTGEGYRNREDVR